MPTWVNEKIIDQLRQYSSPTIADAIELFKIRSPIDGYMGGDIRCFFPELEPMVGYAVTVVLDNRTKERVQSREAQKRYFEAIWNSPKPAVLVIKSLGQPPTHGLVSGGGLAHAAKALGAIGLVSDGAVRDIAAIRGLSGFHVFAPGSVASHGLGAIGGISSVGEPVTISGVLVHSGDILHGDESGVVLVPPEIAADVPARAHEVSNADADTTALLNSPDLNLESYLKFRGL